MPALLSLPLCCPSTAYFEHYLPMNNLSMGDLKQNLGFPHNIPHWGAPAVSGTDTFLDISFLIRIQMAPLHSAQIPSISTASPGASTSTCGETTAELAALIVIFVPDAGASKAGLSASKTTFVFQAAAVSLSPHPSSRIRRSSSRGHYIILW